MMHMTKKIPFVPDRRIEAAAERLLDEFSPVCLRTPGPVPVDDLAEKHLRLQLDFDDLNPGKAEPRELGKLFCGKRSVVIDQRLDPETNPHALGRYRFTLGHEVGHWRLHLPYLDNPEQTRINVDGKPAPDFICRDPSAEQSRSPVEIQANKFASYLLMPREAVLAAWRDIHSTDRLTPRDLLAIGDSADLRTAPGFAGEFADDDRLLRCKRFVARPFADKFEVSLTAMVIRLEGMNLFQAADSAQLSLIG